MKLQIKCHQCNEDMKTDSGWAYFSHSTEDVNGNIEADYYQEFWECPNRHAAIAWMVDKPPSDFGANACYDGQIDHITNEGGHVIFQEFRNPHNLSERITQTQNDTL